MASGLPAVGNVAPDFSLRSGGGETVTLSALRGRRVVLYFYPKDDTPGCTKEACAFQAARPQLEKTGAVVVGVSADSPESHERFATKYDLTFPLLSDPDAAVARAYGVYQQKSLYGRTYWGIERTTFVIDPQGYIAAVFPKVRVDGHTEAILEALRVSASSARTSASRSADA